MADFPEFDDAAVWVIWLSHLTSAEVSTAERTLVDALPERAPIVSAITRDDDQRGSRNPAFLGLGIWVAKEAIKGGITVIKDKYRADQAAKKSYDDRAECYNRERDKYLGRM